MFVDGLVRLLAFYKVVSGRIAIGALFGVSNVINSIGVSKV